MTKEEAKDFLFDMSNLIGTTAIEHWTEKDAEKMRQAVLIIENESAQPEPHYDEWCTDCKEYNQERHCCPRWNKVIKQTVEDLKGADRKWIPCVDGNEPKANAECWISTNAKFVGRAIYAPRANNQPNGFIVTVGSFGFYEYGKSAKAWMPYTQEPEPYKEGEQDG